jgi:hypothetical protein
MWKIKITLIGCSLDACEEWLLSSPPRFNFHNDMNKAHNEYVIMASSLYVLESCLWLKNKRKSKLRYLQIHLLKIKWEPFGF